MRTLGTLAGLWTTLFLVLVTHAIELDIDDEQSIKEAASKATWGAMTYYHGNESGSIPGNIPQKWYEGGALFLTTINYWYFTNDSQYNDVTKVGLEFQGEPGDFYPTNWTTWIGNDDQLFWSFAAMTAAEMNFPETGQYSWLSLAQGVFNAQTAAPTPQNTGWDPNTCGGGVHWQKYIEKPGYDLKNAISNGGLFQLSARLYRYTNRSVYAEWAEKIWDWSVAHDLVNNVTWEVNDGVSTNDDCQTPDPPQWTYNYGTFLMGAAYMYNNTSGADQERWLNNVYGLANATLDKFFLKKNGYILEELGCDPFPVCTDSNELLFKGPTSLWLGWTAILVPQIYEQIMPKLQYSAQGAAASCIGGRGDECGGSWYMKKFDNKAGLEPQMTASNIFSINLIPFSHAKKSKGPLTASTGGTSKGNFNAGKNDPNKGHALPPITTGDRVGAGILTAVMIATLIGTLAWMLVGEDHPGK
ncbi:hypothetical protein N7474_009105, partial [Penicillium riverlandense]|uniref:uncharacterized protein n=1 Tax=Penicillium riverlandense TaxID=1903569 RepID=UPI0025468792